MPNRRVKGGLLIALALCLAASLGAAPAPAAAAEPTGYEHFHTYAEMTDVINGAVADHPSIAAKFSIGRSYEGRAIRAIRLTAHAGAGNQGRPEVFINGLMHARERASAELAIHMIEVLTNNYGLDSDLGRRVTAILQSTVVYIVPMMNPDGAEYDFSGGRFHSWRKNRQPVDGGSAVGIDLNRQFGYTWGCCGGSSANPSSDFYRGPSALAAPEARAYRNFINGRVANGRQRLEGILSLHSAGKMVLWPYAYTRADLPSDMQRQDLEAMVALGRGMAARNGYRAMQASDLYIVDGDADDDAYGRHGIYAFTIEMAKGSAKRYYPSRSELARDLDRNRSAILWFLEQMGAGAGSAADPGSSADPGGADGSASAGAATPKYAQIVLNSALVQPQLTNCWCVVASTRAWLRHMDPTFEVAQSDLNEFMTAYDKNDWTDESQSFHIRCSRGSPAPSFAHDGRGMAWTLWNHRPADLDHGFQDYMTTGAKAMNWQFVRNIRASGQPVGAIVAAGRHAILVVGYKTKLDPFAEYGQDNRLFGFRVWDPWYQAGFGNWSGWPAGGFAGNAYVTVQDWNQKYFRPDRYEGPYYYGRYVGVLPTATVEPPSDNPGRSYGQVAYEAAKTAIPPELPPDPPPDPPSATVAAAISSGLRTHDLLGDPQLGNLPASYTLGNSVEVEQLSGGGATYLLVELRVGSRVRAVALVNRTRTGYVFGELRATTGAWRLPTTSALRATLAANGLSGQPRLVWGWTDEPSPPFAPFLAGTNDRGRFSVVTAAGVVERQQLLRSVNSSPN